MGSLSFTILLYHYINTCNNIHYITIFITSIHYIMFFLMHFASLRLRGWPPYVRAFLFILFIHIIANRMTSH